MNIQNLTSPKLAASLLLILASSQISEVKAQNVEYQNNVAIKTNLLSGAFLSPSLSVELPTVSDHWTIDLTGEVNQWDAWNNQKWQHWAVQPEARYWFEEAFNRFFIGLHAMGGQYNLGNMKHHFPTFAYDMSDTRNFRYEGAFFGGGVGLGYAWQWSRHWGLEAELGFGYMRMRGDKYDLKAGDVLIQDGVNYNYVGPTKAALNLVYRFNKKKNAPATDLEPAQAPARPEIAPSYLFVRPVAETVKARSLEGQAYVEFDVYKSDIQPELANNRQELDKIIASIDSIRNNPDAKNISLSIKGYSSPDGPYEQNAALAKARTEQLSKYVKKLYKFDSNTLTTSYEPEDWEGWRRLVDASDLPHRQEILNIMDNKKLTLDQKEIRIKEFADDYDMMRGDILKRLRHSDYVISYTIDSYTSAEDIRKVLNTRPGNLSLAEFYTAAEGYTEGSEEFNKIFLTAVKYYPNDEAANLNAANAYMAKGQLTEARRHLEKAGKSREALYARGVYQSLTGNYAEAISYLQQANNAGIEDANKLISTVQNRMEWEKQWGK